MKLSLNEKIGSNLMGTTEKIKAMESNIGAYRMIPVTQIKYNPQNRRNYTELQVQELADSIKEIGLQQNIVVLQQGNDYMLLVGEKRTRAHKLLSDGLPGYDNIYALVYQNLDEIKQEVIMLQTNQLATVDTPQERAEVAQRINELVDTLISQGKRTGSRRDMISEITGKSGKQVERDLKLSKIIPELLELAKEKGLAQSGIVEFASIPKADQLNVYNMLKTMTEAGNKPNREEIIQLSKEHKENLKKLQDENQTLLREKESLEDKLQDMRHELDTMSLERSKFVRQLMEKDSDIENIREQLESEQNNGNSKEIESLSVKLNDAEKERQIMKNIIENKDKEIQDIQRQMQQTHEGTAKNVEQNAELSGLLAVLESTFKDVVKKYRAMDKNSVSTYNKERLMELSEKIMQEVQK